MFLITLPSFFIVMAWYLSRLKLWVFLKKINGCSFPIYSLILDLYFHSNHFRYAFFKFGHYFPRSKRLKQNRHWRVLLFFFFLSPSLNFQSSLPFSASCSGNLSDESTLALPRTGHTYVFPVGAACCLGRFSTQRHRTLGDDWVCMIEIMLLK